MNDESWRERAACRGLPGDIFFDDIWKPGVEEDGPMDEEAVERARAICASCPVRTECYQAAMDEEGGSAEIRRHGIRGGTTPAQRYSIWRRDSSRCDRCGEVYDPLGLIVGDVVCQCGSFSEPEIPNGGDRWFPRHDGLLKRLTEYLLQNTEVGDRILPPYKMLLELGHRRKDDMPLVYERLIEQGLIVQGGGRHPAYYRAGGNQALRSFRPYGRRG